MHTLVRQPKSFWSVHGASRVAEMSLRHGSCSAVTAERGSFVDIFSWGEVKRPFFVHSAHACFGNSIPWGAATEAEGIPTLREVLLHEAKHRLQDWLPDYSIRFFLGRLCSWLRPHLPSQKCILCGKNAGLVLGVLESCRWPGVLLPWYARMVTSHFEMTDDGTSLRGSTVQPHVSPLPHQPWFCAGRC